MRLGVAAALVDGLLVKGDVEVLDGCISAVGLSAPAGRGIAVPGFVDLQVNGFGGVDFLDADADGYRRAGEALLETGVTAYLPTLITSPEQQILAAMREVPIERCTGRASSGCTSKGRSSRRTGSARTRRPRAAIPTWRCSTGCSTRARCG